jgi:hypothetical protein
MLELPPHSRISLRIDGGATTITIPKASGPLRGCLGGSWAAVSAFAFLAVTFTAQGVLSGNPRWTVAGLFCALLAAWQMVALHGLPAGHVRLEISPDQISRITGHDKSPQRQQWPRSAISGIRVDSNSNPAALSLHFNNRQPPACILSGNDPAELNWIAEQIRKKWGMTGTDSGSLG